jgi:hypothetical protein
MEWSKQIGIFTENRKYQEYEKYANEKIWASGAVWA